MTLKVILRSSSDHVEVGIDTVQHGHPLSFVLSISDGQFSEVIADESRHAETGFIGLSFEIVPFVFGEANAEHVGAYFVTHIGDIALFILSINKATRGCYATRRLGQGASPLTTLKLKGLIFDEPMYILLSNF